MECYVLCYVQMCLHNQQHAQCCGVGDLHSLEGKQLADKYHALYVTALKDLYEQHKDLYALDRVSSLRLVE